MDSSRETKSISTPSGKEVVLNAYLLGGDVMELERSVLDASSIDGKGGMSVSAGDAYTKRLDKLVDLVIISIDGKTGAEKMPALKALRAADYSFVMKEVEAIAQGLSAEKKS